MGRRSISKIEEDYFVEKLISMKNLEVVAGFLQMYIQKYGPLSNSNAFKVKKHLDKLNKEKETKND